MTVYVRTKTPLGSAAPDGKRVSELFVILVPADDANERNLLLLALVAEAFSDRDFRARLPAVSDVRDVRSTFARWISSREVAAIEGAADCKTVVPKVPVTVPDRARPRCRQ